ncbi:hypothetical protein DV20_12880 [Amycolatopsis rifamycinica]|uniref:Uncharacterized protein n=1 Tax=Amycolatopsis rifamycinica TaxID=287986 RepID=A0A066UCG2_9PSEU|nr:hypothetical protein DV20_12880 [Amycolatopsis rifamycinica]
MPAGYPIHPAETPPAPVIAAAHATKHPSVALTPRSAGAAVGFGSGQPRSGHPRNRAEDRFTG